MKSSQPFFRILYVALIIVSILGVFEESSFNFLKDVAKRNSEFLATITEIKMIIAGLSSINIPFVSGHSQGIENSLAKVENYLLLTDTITFLQVLFISICKSIYFKILLIALFILSYFDNNKRLFTKLLIIGLALSPGLSLYTVAVKHLSSTSQIHFGESYLSELKASANAITKENALLMQEHNQEITKINNGQKGLILMRKLKEDITYDVRKTRTDIKGDYTNIRSIIKSAGYEMLNKVFRFCTMILFCLLIMPLGYALIIKTLIQSQFGNASLEAAIAKIGTDKQEIETELKKKTFFQKLAIIWTAIRTEFIKGEQDIEHSPEFQNLQQKVEQLEEKIKLDVQKRSELAENKLKSSVQTIAEDAKASLQHKMQEGKQLVTGKLDNIDTVVKDDITSVEGKVHGDVQTDVTNAQDKIDAVKSEIQNDFSTIEGNAKNDAQTALTDGKGEVNTVKSDLQSDASTAQGKIKEDVQNLVTDREDKIDTVKSEAQTDVSSAQRKIKGDVQTDLTDGEDKINTVKSDVQNDITHLDDKTKTDVSDLKNEATNDSEQARDKLDQTETTVKDDASETVNEVKDKAETIVGDAKQKTQDLPKPKISL